MNVCMYVCQKGRNINTICVYVYVYVCNCLFMSKRSKLTKTSFILAIRTVAAGHRMIADGWGMFEEVVTEAGAGDLPQLLRSVRSMTTLPPATPPPAQSTPPPARPTPPQGTPSPVPMDVQHPSPSPIKKELSDEEPILIRVGEKISYSCPQCETVIVSKNGCDAHIRAVHTGKALRCAYCAFSSYNKDSLNRHQREHN